MPKGKPERLRFALIPTSWTFARGGRIRIAIAGADAVKEFLTAEALVAVLRLRVELDRLAVLKDERANHAIGLEQIPLGLVGQPGQ